MILGHPQGKPVDSWSFGCLLVHMGSRVPPFARLGHHVTAHEVMDQVVKGELTPLDALDSSNCPPLLLQLTLECVAVDPLARPSMAAIAARLTEPPMRASVRPNGGPERPTVPLQRPSRHGPISI